MRRWTEGATRVSWERVGALGLNVLAWVALAVVLVMRARV